MNFLGFFYKNNKVSIRFNIGIFELFYKYFDVIVEFENRSFFY